MTRMQMSLAEFATQPADATTFVSFTDPAVPTISGHNDVNSCAVWGHGGKRKVVMILQSC